MSRSSDAHVFAVYDISSSSVAGAHVLSTQASTKKPIFLANARMDAPLLEDMDIKRFVDGTVANLDTVIANVKASDVHHPSYIQVVLASPWYNSLTRTILYKKDTPIMCTEKLVESLITNEINHILEHHNGPFGPYGKESLIIEKQLSSIKLNGYATDMPYDKKAQSIEITLTLTIAPKQVLDLFSDALKRAYGPRKIGYTTSPFSTFVVGRDMLPIQEECVIIDVGEELTDVAFVKRGTMLYQHSFPVGTYGLYRALAKQTRHTTSEAVAMLESYRLGKLKNTHTKGIEKAITAFTESWQTGFQQILDTRSYGFCMPHQVVVTSDSRFESILMTIITTDPFIKHSCARDAVVMTFMNQSLLQPSIHSTNLMPLDIPLATGALFAERLT